MAAYKEISIRKVLGAMPANIIVILSKDFLMLVIIASLVAFPVAWWAMHAWLQNLAGSIAFFIAIVTISYHAIRSAFINLIKSLKPE